MAETYYLHNTTRSPATAGQRRQLTADQRSRKNLTIGGGAVSIRRGRPSPVSEALVRRHAGEIAQLVSNGLLRVTDGRQREVDVSTMKVANRPIPSAELRPEVSAAAAPPPASPPPTPIPPTQAAPVVAEPEPEPEPEVVATEEAPVEEPAPEEEESKEETLGESMPTSKKKRRR